MRWARPQHWLVWPKPENRCFVPANGFFAEYAPEPNPETKKPSYSCSTLAELLTPLTRSFLSPLSSASLSERGSAGTLAQRGKRVAVLHS